MKKNKKQFGVWMDSHQASIVGRDDSESGEFNLLAIVKNPGASANSNENAANNQEISLKQKYFKDITAKMVNIDEIHITGTGQIQEEFIKFLAESPQYKNVASSESTSSKMKDDQLVAHFTKHFN
jgi:stalled ribosome rescue protein Dom34